MINESNEQKFIKEGLKSLDINSMSFIKIVVSVEEEFDIQFDDYELNFELFESLDDLVQLVHKKMEE